MFLRHKDLRSPGTSRSKDTTCQYSSSNLCWSRLSSTDKSRVARGLQPAGATAYLVQDTFQGETALLKLQASDNTVLWFVFLSGRLFEFYLHNHLPWEANTKAMRKGA